MTDCQHSRGYLQNSGPEVSLLHWRIYKTLIPSRMSWRLNKKLLLIDARLGLLVFANVFVLRFERSLKRKRNIKNHINIITNFSWGDQKYVKLRCVGLVLASPDQYRIEVVNYFLTSLSENEMSIKFSLDSPPVRQQEEFAVGVPVLTSSPGREIHGAEDGHYQLLPRSVVPSLHLQPAAEVAWGRARPGGVLRQHVRPLRLLPVWLSVRRLDVSGHHQLDAALLPWGGDNVPDVLVSPGVERYSIPLEHEVPGQKVADQVRDAPLLHLLYHSAVATIDILATNDLECSDFTFWSRLALYYLQSQQRCSGAGV